MIVSPRAQEIIDILRWCKNAFIKIDEVFLYHRVGAGAPYRKTHYWMRNKDSNIPRLTSFAIVPEMLAAVHRGFGITGNLFSNANAVNAWQAFDQSMLTSGTFGTFNANASGDNRYAWAMVTFPEPRIVRGWALQFGTMLPAFWMAIMSWYANSNRRKAVISLWCF